MTCVYQGFQHDNYNDASINYTLSSEKNRYIVALVSAWRGNGTALLPASLTYDGKTMTDHGDQPNADNQAKVGIQSYRVPASDSGAKVITYTGSFDHASHKGLVVIELYNCGGHRQFGSGTSGNVRLEGVGRTSVTCCIFRAGGKFAANVHADGEQTAIVQNGHDDADNAYDNNYCAGYYDGGAPEVDHYWDTNGANAASEFRAVLTGTQAIWMMFERWNEFMRRLKLPNLDNQMFERGWSFMRPKIANIQAYELYPGRAFRVA